MISGNMAIVFRKAAGCAPGRNTAIYLRSVSSIDEEIGSI